MEIIRKNGRRRVLELEGTVIPPQPPVTGVSYNFGTFANPNDTIGYNFGTFTKPTTAVINMGTFKD